MLALVFYLESFRNVCSPAEEWWQRPKETQSVGDDDHAHCTLLGYLHGCFKRVGDDHVSVIGHPSQGGDRHKSKQSSKECIQLTT